MSLNLPYKTIYVTTMFHNNQRRSWGYCRPGPNIYGRPYWCSRNTFASEIAAPVWAPLLPLLGGGGGGRDNLVGLLKCDLLYFESRDSSPPPPPV